MIPDWADTTRLRPIMPHIRKRFPLKKQDAQRPKDSASLVMGLSRWRKDSPAT
jgi:hypothetical protein